MPRPSPSTLPDSVRRIGISTITITSSTHNYDGTPDLPDAFRHLPRRAERKMHAGLAYSRAIVPGLGRARALVEEIVDLARGLGADAGNLGEILERGALDGLERPEMVKQRPLASWADAGDFLQPSLADIAPPPDAVRPDRETVRLVAQPLHEIEHGIARLELERLAP